MSKVQADKTKRQATGRILGLGVFEKISAVEGVQLTDDMRRDLLSFERLGLSSDERTRFITEKYGRKAT